MLYREVGDLIQEEGAALGHLESANPVSLRVGERALNMAEHFTFKHTFGEPADVDGDHRL